jgi:multidrug efflux pump
VAVALNVYLLYIVPKSFFPSTDEGRIRGGLRASQTISFQLFKKKFQQFEQILSQDPAIEHVAGSASGSNGSFTITLKPKSERGGLSTADVIARLQPKLAVVSGANVFLSSDSATGIRAGGRAGNGSYQYTILGDTVGDLNEWVPKITDALSAVPELDQVNSDQQAKGLEIALNIDRNSAARLGLTPTQIDSALGNAFSQKSVSTIYKDKNQYHVIMEVSKDFWQSPDSLKDFYVSTSGGAISGSQATAVVTSAAPAVSSASSSGGTTDAAQAASDAVRNAQQNAITSTGKGSSNTGSAVSTRVETMVPLEAFSTYGPGFTPLSVQHQGPFAAVTFSFETADGVSLDTAVQAIQKTMADIHVPLTLHGEFAGTAKTFQSSLANEPILILAAIVTIYIVLGILYESLIHPITILSTLPSACVGAILALLIFKTDFSMIAFIGVILLIGIVKKNAIIMIDFAIALQRAENLDPKEAIFRASVMRFRPIMMTTLGAILGGIPLAVGLGEGSELRQPLGISIVGGLMLSQVLTLYTTPLVYLYLDQFGTWVGNAWNRRYHGMMQSKGHHDVPPGIQPAE